MTNITEEGISQQDSSEHLDTLAGIHSDTRMLKHPQTHACTHANTYTHTHTHTHAHVHVHAHTHTLCCPPDTDPK
jgi:hypothetical protein